MDLLLTVLWWFEPTPLLSKCSSLARWGNCEFHILYCSTFAYLTDSTPWTIVTLTIIITLILTTNLTDRTPLHYTSLSACLSDSTLCTILAHLPTPLIQYLIQHPAASNPSTCLANPTLCTTLAHLPIWLIPHPVLHHIPSQWPHTLHHTSPSAFPLM